MKPIYTTICAICFMIAGIATVLNEAPWRAKAQAEPVILDYSKLPIDLQLGLLRPKKAYEVYRDTITDTVHNIVNDTTTVIRYKTKYKVVTKTKQVEPDPLPRKADTLYVPVVQLQIPLRKEALNDSTIHYIHAVDSVVGVKHCNPLPQQLVSTL